VDFHKHALILGMVENLRNEGSRTGKTHIIKGLMLAAAAKAEDVPFEFFLYKHGPYSTDIEENLEQMQSYGALTIAPAFDGYGVILKPGEMARYAKLRAPLSEEEEKAIGRVCQLIRSKNVGQLERLATAAWIRTRLGIQESDAVALKLTELKPHVSLSDALDADREVSAFLQGH
jgi:hypothetical protein